MNDPLDLKGIQLQLIEQAARRFYLDLQDKGMTLQQMSNASGLPVSTFSMWLGGYRPMVKLDVLQKAIDAVDALEAEAELLYG